MKQSRPYYVFSPNKTIVQLEMINRKCASEFQLCRDKMTRKQFADAKLICIEEEVTQKNCSQKFSIGKDAKVRTDR